jgi:ribonuclease E
MTLPPAAPVVPPTPVVARAAPQIVVPVTAATAPAAPAPKAQPAPLPVDQLLPVLQGAGLQLVQTEASKLAHIQAKMAAEPKPARVPRERPLLPPLDSGPLVQVETRRP